MSGDTTKYKKAIFASGCFWGTQYYLAKGKGVISTEVGFTGGTKDNPTYKEVCTGKTGHTESIQIEFDPTVIPYEKILDVFWHTHDPTTLNRQGNDVGTQYRSAIFYHNPKQKEIAEKSKRDLEKAGVYKNPIVTEITPFKNFYVAEDYHKNYYEEHQDAPYCSVVINPKVRKLIQKYGNDLENKYK